MTSVFAPMLEARTVGVGDTWTPGAATACEGQGHSYSVKRKRVPCGF